MSKWDVYFNNALLFFAALCLLGNLVLTFTHGKKIEQTEVVEEKIEQLQEKQTASSERIEKYLNQLVHTSAPTTQP